MPEKSTKFAMLPTPSADKSGNRPHRHLSRRSEGPADHAQPRLPIWCDRIVIAGLACLMVFSPLAIGSVNPWALCTVETVIFVLTIIWMARLALDDKPQVLTGLRALAIPGGLFIALILFQLVPLPPTIEHALFPSTYHLYATSLPGWPEREAYPLTDGRRSGGESAAAIHGAASAGDRKASPPRPAAGWLDAISRWRPVSIAPALTAAAALEVIACACLFFLVLFYPLRRYPRPKGERRFCRRILKVALLTGLAMGCIGLLEQAFWNGAILWLYVPYDWGAPRPGFDPRASGPFVDPDHFAAYLNMIMPLALAGALFPTFLSRGSSSRGPFRLLCLATAAILVAAVALSLSRGGWIAGLLGASIVIWLALRARWRGQHERGDVWLKITGSLYVVALIAIVAGSALYTAPTAPTAVHARLQTTIAEPDLDTRIGYWRDSLTLIRHYPVLGAGLGAFQDLFPRYQSPPWSPASVREAHNDYLELAADTGAAGLALVLWFFAVAGLRVYRGLKTSPGELLPLVAGLMAGLAAMAFQEFFDFALQIPANAILFTIFLAVVLRLSGAGRRDDSVSGYSPSRVRRFAAGASAAAVFLIVMALRQNMTPYPYLPALPHNAPAARALILEHPARATPHLWYAALSRGSAADQLRELKIAASLEPHNPLILDRYAQALAAAGRTDKALAELTRSVFVYPSMADHFYLQPEMIPWLSMNERKAIEAGFRMAVAHRFNGASTALAAFYAAIHHDAAEARVLTGASSAASQPSRRMQLLLDAGVAYAQAGDRARAAAAFQQAARLEPSNPKPYQYLLSRIFAPRKDIDSAKAVVQRGLENGADPFTLYLSLAQVCEQAGDLDGAEAALVKAAKLRPDRQYDYDTLIRLADLEMRARHFGRAVLWMRQAVEMRPASPDALYKLALAEEADYQYGPALRDLAKALKIAPDNAAMKKHYADLQRMIAVHSGHQNQ